MDILLLGRTSSVTHTINSMLNSVDDWNTSIHAEWEENEVKNLSRVLKEYNFDLLITNLEDFNTPPVDLIQEIRQHLPVTPLLVVHSYENEPLIKPLIQAGALGYLQTGIPEEKLYESVRSVANGEESIVAESTY